MNSKPLPLFLLGIPRSGTTLLMGLLDGHPELVVDAGESRYFSRFLPAARRAGDFRDRVEIAERELLHMFDRESVYYRKFLKHVSAERVRENFRKRLQALGDRPPSYLQAYILGYGDAIGKDSDGIRFWIEKTPYNELRLDSIRRWWPDAHFIHVVRDPRDVLASYRLRQARKSEDGIRIPAFSFGWRRSARVALTKLAELGEGSYLLLRYEDMVANLESTMERVRSFLSVRPPVGGWRPTKGDGVVAWAGNEATSRQLGAVSSSPVGRHKDVLSAEEVSVVEDLLAPEMQQLGYESATAGPRVPRYRRWMAHAELELRQLKARLESSRVSPSW